MNLTQATGYDTTKYAVSNIRKELRAAFKGVKFQVRKGFHTVNVNWVDGPTEFEVNKIVFKYVQATDFSKKYGKLDFANARRAYSKTALQIVRNEVEKLYDLHTPEISGSFDDANFDNCEFYLSGVGEYVENNMRTICKEYAKKRSF